MKPTEAAKVLGCTKQHVRLLIRTGKLKAKRKVIKFPKGKKMYQWDISEAEIHRFQITPQTTGRPRGSGRKPAPIKLARPKRMPTFLDNHI